MSIYDYICFLFSISILLAFITHKVSKRVQSTIAITAFAMLGSLILLLFGAFGWLNLDTVATNIIKQLDFKNFLLNGMLGFLLFAGSLGIKLPLMKDQRWEIGAFALFSTLASSLLIATFLYYIAPLAGLQIDFIYCVVFGALISPTDPIAVLAIIKNLRAPKRLSMQVEGESLFNDGVGLVIFTTVFSVAFSGQEATTTGILTLFLQEAIGGILFGLLLGLIAHWLISATDDGSLEVLLTLTIPTAGFTMANLLHISGPLAMVISGIIIGNWTRRQGFSEQSQLYLDRFWEMIDHSLNYLLFLLIGLALLLIEFTWNGSMMMLLAIPICLASRYLSLWIPFKIMQRFREYNPYTLRILTWGGLRGGLSLALALAVPANMAMAKGTDAELDVRDLILLMTYAVVTFSILVQGITIEKMIERAKLKDPKRKAYAKLGAGNNYPKQV